jgi:uncharacterized membrane protein YcaP (DUF421 family)
MMTELFVMGVPLAEKVLRALAVYLFLVVAFRFAGKRLLAQLNPFDLVLILILSNTVQNALIGPDNSVLGGIVGASVLLVVNGAMVRALYRFPKLESLVEGCETKLIEEGVIRDKALEAERITRTELMTAAHKQSVDMLADVKTAAIDPGGAIWFERRTPTPDELRHREVMERLERIERAVSRDRPL